MAVVLMVAHSSALFIPHRAPHPGRVQSSPRMQFSFGKLPGTPAVANPKPLFVDEKAAAVLATRAEYEARVAAERQNKKKESNDDVSERLRIAEEMRVAAAARAVG